jgi:Leucine-rich repeat (LRR) protein
MTKENISVFFPNNLNETVISLSINSGYFNYYKRYIEEQLKKYTKLKIFSWCASHLNEVPIIPEWIEEINYGRNRITLLDKYHIPSKVKILKCWENKIKNIECIQLQNLEELYCENNEITELDNLPPNLKILICNNNKITNLDNLPQGLEKLDCSTNNISSLDNLPFNLKILNCCGNNISSLDNLPPNLEILWCGTDILISLDNLPRNLKELYLFNSSITKLDNLPSGLIKLVCNHNKITNLDNLPPNLKILKCRLNNITSLDNLPQSLNELDCSQNNIISIGKNSILNNLKRLNCYQNKIIKLDNLPDTVEYLDFSKNCIKVFDKIPLNIKHIDSKDNPIKYNYYHNNAYRYKYDLENGKLDVEGIELTKILNNMIGCD